MNELKLVVFDFDGVFTNGNYKHRDVHCRDTYGLLLLKDKYKVGICTRSDGKHIPQIILDRVDFVINNCTSKYQKIKTLGFADNEISYMGDDTHDLECVSKFKYSACPGDAHPKVREAARFVSKCPGGNCAVREYIDYLIAHDGKITAIIPVRSGSSRCKNKNIRTFGNGNSNLLKLKIQTLKKVQGFHKIIVSSNDEDMLKVAREEGVIAVKRDEKYCTTQCSGSDMYCALAEAVDTEFMMYTHCVCPFISVETYENMIQIWRNNRDCDSIMTAHELHEYLWYKDKPLNYEFDNAPPSQNIKDYYIPTFGACLCNCKFVLKNRNIIGYKPYFYKVSQLEAIDIDTPFDFFMAEQLYNSDIKQISDIHLGEGNTAQREKLFLDCTLRDGGYLTNWEFSDKRVLDCYKAVTDAGMDYFEIGFRTNKEKLPGKGPWCYSTEEDINRIYDSYQGCNNYRGCKIAVMAKLGTVSLSDFVPKKDSHVDLVRVLVPHNNAERISVIEESLANSCRDMCVGLLDLGYEVCINLACIDHVKDSELELIMTKLEGLLDSIKVVYIADTYGTLNEKTTKIHVERVARYGVRVGMHAHNNLGNAMAKSLVAYNHPAVLFVDSCIGGMGRGCGNLWGELFFMALGKNYIPLLLHSDEYLDNRKTLLYALTGHLNIHPDFVDAILKLDVADREGSSEGALNMSSILSILSKVKDRCAAVNKHNYIKGLVEELME